MIKGWIMGLFRDDDRVKLLNELGLGEFVEAINNRDEIEELNKVNARLNEKIKVLKQLN